MKLLGSLPGVGRARLEEWRMRAGAELQRQWSARNSRERVLLGGLAVVLVLALGWELLWWPAWSQIQQLERELPQRRAQWEHMQAAAAAFDGVTARKFEPAKAARPVTQDLRSALPALEAGQARLEPGAVQGEWILTWRQAPFTILADWLEQIRQHQRIMVEDAHLERTAGVGVVNARVRLRETRE